MGQGHPGHPGHPGPEPVRSIADASRGLAGTAMGLLALVLGLVRSSAQVVDLSGEWQMLLVPPGRELAEPPPAHEFGQTVRLPGFVTEASLTGRPGKSPTAIEPVADADPGRRPGTGGAPAAVRQVDLRISNSPAVPRGWVWFSREVEVPGWWQGDRVALSLESVSGETRVWVDGHTAGHRPADPDAADLDLTEVLVPGRHRLVLRVDNRPAPGSAAAGGEAGVVSQVPWLGVLGRMELRASPKVRLGRVRVLPGNGDRSLRLEVPLENLLAGVGSAGLGVEPDRAVHASWPGGLIHRSEVTLGFGTTQVTVEVPLPEPLSGQASDPFGFGRLRLSLSGTVLDRGVQHETAVAFRLPRPLPAVGSFGGSDSRALGVSGEWTVDPAAVPEAPPAGVRIVHRFDAQARSELEQGRIVLLLPNALGRVQVPWPATGLVYSPEHPVFRDIPIDDAAFWYWHELLSGAGWSELDGVPTSRTGTSGRGSGPVLAWRGSGTAAAIRPLWFEARVARGRLAVVALDLETGLEHRPLTRAFRSRLLRHLGSAEFRPQTRFDAAVLADWLGAPTNRGQPAITP